ncbi:hypothetical protein [Kaistella carnis]|uniref:hypothetical protein n=1 Tax=Kaistella carnis TaxID=1241979 RepID=UPI0028A26BA9|nr:hypothetical protein [Kaistella carnis]
MKRYLLISAVIFSTTDCQEKSSKNQVSFKDINIVKDTLAVIKEKNIDDPINNKFPDLPNKSFPLIDSTNFDNYQNLGIKNDLFFKKIQFKKDQPEIQNSRLRYQLHFSEKFQSVVISYYQGEHELFTTLVNISENDQIIDQLDIAYDEIAESAFRKTSSINQNKIVVEDWNYMNDEPIKTITTYQISQKGKFKLIPQ